MNNELVRKNMECKAAGIRRKGLLKLIWIDGIRENLRKIGIGWPLGIRGHGGRF